MDTKYANNPYTLDAKSTLAVEFINEAQTKVNAYLACQGEISSAQKQDLYKSGLQLEKAIKIIGEDDADYARALMGRMYLLKASGDFGKDGANGNKSVAFQNAYAALSINPDGAYIQNKLALLHFENNQPDSAIYYAEKAAKTAPNWKCALNTLSLVRNPTKQPGENKPGNPATKKPIRKSSFGVVAGSGVSQLNPTYKETGNTSIVGVNPKNIIKFDVGIIYQVSIGKVISIRPATQLSIEGGELVYERRSATGGVNTLDPVKLKNTSVSFSLPIIIRLSDKNIAPFIMMGPTYNYIVNQNADAAKKVPLKKSVLLADAGLGVDIALAKSGLVLSPEIKYSQGLNNLKEDARTEYTNTVSSLKKRGITFSVYLRKQ